MTDQQDWEHYHLIKGLTKLNEDPRSAIKHFDLAIRAIELTSDSAPFSPNRADYCYYQRGCAKKKLGEYKEAIRDFNKAIELNPEYQEAYAHRGCVKSFQFREYEEAIQDFDKAIELYPKGWTYLNRGYAKGCLRQYDEAKEDYQTTLRLAREANNKGLEEITNMFLKDLINLTKGGK